MLFHGIGENSSALYCLTDRERCCSSNSGMRLGLWHFPDGNNVSNNKNDAAGIYVRRGFSSIRLNRKRDVMMSTGVYTCLPDSKFTSNRILRIAIYSNVSQGKFSGGPPLHKKFRSIPEVIMYVHARVAQCNVSKK